MKIKALYALALVGVLAQVAQAQDEQVTRMNAALSAPARSAENKARDAARKPVETIQFFHFKTGDKVIEMIAAGGWFTEVLSAAVGPTGKVYASNPPGLVPQEAENTLHKRLGNVEAVRTALTASSINGKADDALIALNLHDIFNGFNGQSGGEAATVEFLKTIYAQLKPGGILGVIDHAGVTGQDNAKLHRMLPQQARDVLIKAGFTIEAESTLFANAGDDHSKSVFDPALRGRTDQFMFRARKPGQ